MYKEYKLGRNFCKMHFLGKFILFKGDKALIYQDLCQRPFEIWKHLHHWSMVSLDRDFFQFYN